MGADMKLATVAEHMAARHYAEANASDRLIHRQQADLGHRGYDAWARLIADGPDESVRFRAASQSLIFALHQPRLAVSSLIGIGANGESPTYADLYSGDWEHLTVSGHGRKPDKHETNS